MRKRLILPILIISIVIQLLVPVGMIAYGNKAADDLQKYGKEYKFKVDVYNIYNGVIEFSIYDNIAPLYKDGKYAIVEEDSEGFASFTETVTTKPDKPNYIRINKENRIKIQHYSIESEYKIWKFTEESAYIILRVYNGDFEIVDLYMDGIPVEEWVENRVCENGNYNENLFQ